MGFDVEQDYYTILEVDRNANAVEITKAYRARAKVLHPDKNQGSTEKFQALSQAYEVLGDPKERRKYDDERRARGYDQPEKTAPGGSKMKSQFPTFSSSYARPANRPGPTANNERRGATGYEKRNIPKAFGTSSNAYNQFSKRKYNLYRGPNGEWTPFPGFRERDRSPHLAAEQSQNEPTGRNEFSSGEGINSPSASQTSHNREQKPSRSTSSSGTDEAQIPNHCRQTFPGHNPSVSTGANTASQHARPTADPPNRAHVDAMSSERGLEAKRLEHYHLPELLILASPKPPGPASNSYHAEMNTYAVNWNAWEGSMLSHFEARHRSYANELPLTCIEQMGQCYSIIYNIYSQGKLQDMKARHYWLQQEEEHLSCMEHFWGTAADLRTHFPSLNDSNIPKPPQPHEYGQKSGYIQRMSTYIGEWNEFEFRVLSQLDARYHETPLTTPLTLDKDYSIRYLERKREDIWLRSLWDELEQRHLYCMVKFWQTMTTGTS